MSRQITALLQYAGCNRLNADLPARLLGPCRDIWVPFAGGMPEIPHLDASRVMVNDLNGLAITLAEVVSREPDRRRLIEMVEARGFGQQQLDHWRAVAQDELASPVHRAAGYFASQWMIRGGTTGTAGEFKGKVSVRYPDPKTGKISGGCSKVRFFSALRSLDTIGPTLARCRFSTLDAFRLLDDLEDRPDVGLYSDEPDWHGAGVRYRHRVAAAFDHAAWWQRLSSLRHVRIVLRYADCPEVREALADWRCLEVAGRKQTGHQAELWFTRNIEPEIGGSAGGEQADDEVNEDGERNAIHEPAVIGGVQQAPAATRCRSVAGASIPMARQMAIAGFQDEVAAIEQAERERTQRRSFLEPLRRYGEEWLQLHWPLVEEIRNLVASNPTLRDADAVIDLISLPEPAGRDAAEDQAECVRQFVEEEIARQTPDFGQRTGEMLSRPLVNPDDWARVRRFPVGIDELVERLELATDDLWATKVDLAKRLGISRHWDAERIIQGVIDELGDASDAVRHRGVAEALEAWISSVEQQVESAQAAEKAADATEGPVKKKRTKRPTPAVNSGTAREEAIPAGPGSVDFDFGI